MEQNVMWVTYLQDRLIDVTIELVKWIMAEKLKSIQLIIIGGVICKEREQIWLMLGLLIRVWLEVYEEGQSMEYDIIQLGVQDRQLSLLLLSVLLGLILMRREDIEGEVRMIIQLSIGCFSILNLMGFYMYFEGVLFPMYMLILKEGKQYRRRKAGKYLVIYTIVGSIFMLQGIMSIYMREGVWSDIQINIQKWEWICLGLGFLVKVPVIGLHVWLGEGHVEASTEGQMILAGILLKLGTFGLFKYNMERQDWIEGNRIIEVVGSLGIVLTQLSAIRNMDLKRVIAYGSIGHMSMLIVGMSSGRIEGIEGGMIQMVGHGIISSGLFMLIGEIYKRVNTREIQRISGIGEWLPYLSVSLVILQLGNIGIPLQQQFIGELLLLKSIWEINKVVGLMMCLGLFLGSIYSLYMVNRVLMGNVRKVVGEKNDDKYVQGDILREVRMEVYVLISMMLVIGISPGRLI